MELKYYFNDDNFNYQINYQQEKSALLNCNREMLFEYIISVVDLGDYMRDYNIDLKHCSVKELVSAITDEDDYEEYFKEYFEEYFEEKACDIWKDVAAYQKDPYAYNGVSQRDFYKE